MMPMGNSTPSGAIRDGTEHPLAVDTPMTDVVLQVMDWMNDNGHIDEDQIAMVKYYEDKMNVTVGGETNN